MKIFVVTLKLNFLTAGGTTDEYDLTYRTLMEMGHEVVVCTTNPQANNIPHKLPYKVIEEEIKSHKMLGIQRGALKIFKKYSSQADAFFFDGQVFLYGAGLYRLLGGGVPVAGYFNRELAAWGENVSELFNKRQDNIYKRLKKWVRFYFECYILMRLTHYLDIIGFANAVLMKEYGEFGMKIDKRCFIYGDPFDYRGLMKKHNIHEDTYCKRNKAQGPYTILYSSKMAPGKGFDILLTAFSRLKDKDNFRLVLGGDGPEENKVRQMVRDLELGPYVELPGWMTKAELYRRYSEADMFVQARWRDDLTSMSLMTAILFGLPAVLPKGSGLEWLAQDCGYYFKDKDVDDLARKIEQLAADYQLRARLSKNCYIRMDQPELNHKSRIAELEKRMIEADAKKR
jgi:glycosyltransferase involved in cell wall biosynthesis